MRAERAAPTIHEDRTLPRCADPIAKLAPPPPCRTVDHARRGDYRHLARQSQPGPRRARDAVLSAWIEEEFAQSHGTYGVPRLHRSLPERQEPVSRKRLARLMRERGLRGCSPHRRPCATRQQARLAVFDHLHFYHRRRRHRALGFISPVDFENQSN